MHLPWSVRNLILVGFMGSGKSSVGREIARRCALRFLDTDSMIRQRYGKSITEIFAVDGESMFREEEHHVLLRLRGAQKMVLATGGGIVLQALVGLILKVATAPFALLGSLGGGKTQTLQLLLYHALVQGARIVDIDPKGDHRFHLLPEGSL